MGVNYRTSRELKGRVTFLELDAPLRTDLSFCSEDQLQHGRICTRIHDSLFTSDSFDPLDLGPMNCLQDKGLFTVPSL